MKKQKNFFHKRKAAAFRYFLSVFAICGSVVLSVAPVSCRMTEEGIEILPGDKTCPVVESFEVTGSGSFSVTCSEKIVVSSASVNEGGAENPGEELSIGGISYDETGKTAQFALDDVTETGKSYVFSAVISDPSGNSVEFSQEFVGFNENPAVLILNEIRTTAKNPKSDFIEFFCLRTGNTFGLKVSSAYKGSDYDYYFPAMEVEAGEYITLHNRTYDENNSVDETGVNLSLSSAEESSESARDLWREGENLKIGGTSDVIILKDYSTGKIYDGLPYSGSSSENWTKTLQTEYAELLSSEKIWTSGSDIGSAFKSDKATTVNRSISRKNTAEIYKKFVSGEIDFVQSSLEDWALTDKTGKGNSSVSGATPGFENSTNYFSAD